MAVDISPKQDGGILKEIIRDGEGDKTPSDGCTVEVHYTGTLLDGTKFDSSKDRDEPFKFELGQGRVIKAWEIGISTMKKGEVAVLTCSSKYAYGKNGSPPKIPPDATLKFEVEMLGWTGVDLSPEKDGSIEKVQLCKGTDSTSPIDGALVNVHLIGKFNDKIFEERDVEFNIGEGEEAGIVRGVEIALEKLRKGEKAELKIKSKYAFGLEGKKEFSIPANADVIYEVELKNFEKTSDIWTMGPEEKISQAKIFKEKGTKYFKENKLGLAIRMYKKADSFIDSDISFEDNLKTERNELLTAVHSNLALCFLKTNENDQARKSCDEALKVDPSNEKALFRRGLSYLALSSPEIAIKDFEKVVEIESKNAAAAKKILICKNLIEEQRKKEKQFYANMFEKFVEDNKKKEEEKLQHFPDVMRGSLGEWGQEERPGGRDATAFERENPNILMLNANGNGDFRNM